MPDGVLPPLLVLTVVGEQVHYPLVNLTQGKHFAGCLLDGHRDEGDVGVGRFGVRVTSPEGLVVSGPVEVGLRVCHGAHGGAHAGVGVQRVHGAVLSRHGVQVGRAERGAHTRHAAAHPVHVSGGARGHPGHGARAQTGTQRWVRIGHVKRTGSHIPTGGHAHVTVHIIHGAQPSVHAAVRHGRIDLKERKKS